MPPRRLAQSWVVPQSQGTRAGNAGPSPGTSPQRRHKAAALPHCSTAGMSRLLDWARRWPGSSRVWILSPVRIKPSHSWTSHAWLICAGPCQPWSKINKEPPVCSHQVFSRLWAPGHSSSVLESSVCDLGPEPCPQVYRDLDSREQGIPGCEGWRSHLLFSILSSWGRQHRLILSSCEQKALAAIESPEQPAVVAAVLNPPLSHAARLDPTS